MPDEKAKAMDAKAKAAKVKEAKAMAATLADVKEYSNSYVVVVDMPGIKPADIKVQVEGGNVLVINGKRMQKEKEGAKNLRIERSVGKFMRKFSLPKNADTGAISYVYQDGVLTVTVKKLKPKTIEVVEVIRVRMTTWAV